MPSNFMRKYFSLIKTAQRIDLLEVITLQDRLDYPSDQIMQLEADRTMRDVKDARDEIERKFAELYDISVYN